MLLFAISSLRAQDVANQYRLTLFPHHPILGNLTGLGFFGYANNPEERSSTYYVGWPAFNYKANSWLQIWGGFNNRYIDNKDAADEFELRPFIGPKFFLPNEWCWNIYNFLRYEYRDTLNTDTGDWSASQRVRSQFGVEFPLTRGDRVWQPRTWYGLADVEVFYRFDDHTIDPVRARAGLAYILHDGVRLEFIYQAEFSRRNGGSLEYAENEFRLNIKIGLSEGILRRALNPGLEH